MAWLLPEYRHRLPSIYILFRYFRPDNFHGLLHKDRIDLQETSARNGLIVFDAPLAEFYHLVQSVHRHLSGFCPVPLHALQN